MRIPSQFLALGLLCALSTSATATVVVFSGSSLPDGPDGNVRLFDADGITITATAEASFDGGVSWTASYLGLYADGLGVTNPNEGNGSNGRHFVDNFEGIDRVVLDFSDEVMLDRVFLSAFRDTDITVGYFSEGAWNFLEDNGGSYASRWADINESGVTSAKWTISGLTANNGATDAFNIGAIGLGTATVPDAGSSALLLGVGLGSLLAFRAARAKA